VDRCQKIVAAAIIASVTATDKEGILQKKVEAHCHTPLLAREENTSQTGGILLAWVTQ
jgi:hypothetical protein